MDQGWNGSIIECFESVFSIKQIDNFANLMELYNPSVSSLCDTYMHLIFDHCARVLLEERNFNQNDRIPYLSSIVIGDLSCKMSQMSITALC